MKGEPAAARAPRLTPAAKPSLAETRRNRTSGKARGQRVSGGRVAGVIDDHDPVVAAGAAQRRQAIAQLVVALVVDDDHRQRGVVRRCTHRRIITNGPRRGLCCASGNEDCRLRQEGEDGTTALADQDRRPANPETDPGREPCLQTDQTTRTWTDTV